MSRPRGLGVLCRQHGALCSLLGSLCLLIVLCSCSSDHDEQPQEPSVGGTAIVFAAEQQEEATVTRATTPLHEKNIDMFTVWGYKHMTYEAGSYGGLQNVFPGYVVRWQSNSAATTTTNSSGWEYLLTSAPHQTIKYWDWGAKAYRFFAVTGMATGALQENTGDATVYNVSFGADATNPATTPYYSTLWFSTGSAVDYPTRQFGRPVLLEFVQPLSKVRFKFTYVYPREGLLVESPQFRPTDNATDIAIAGTVTLGYPLTGTEVKEAYSITERTSTLTALTEDYDPDLVPSKVYKQTDGGWYTVLANTSQGSYTLEVNVNGEVKTCVVPDIYMQWLPGYSYTYIFKINEEGGVEIDMVQSAFTPWTDIEDTHAVYNW